jgi:putative nucleotidyltransferase with HDIG domain
MHYELKEKKISVSELEIGMYVCRLDRPWEDTSFLIQGFLIVSQEEIDQLIEQCDYVYIETRETLIAKSERRRNREGLSVRGKKRPVVNSKAAIKGNKPQGAELERRVTYINKIPMEKEFSNARQCYLFAKRTAKSIMDGIRIGRTLNIHKVRGVVDQVVSSIINNANALTWLTKIKNKDEYTAEHSLNVCILSVAFARHLGLPEEELRRIGLCGLLHDVGKAKIPDEILNKPGRFTDEEMDIMKLHTVFGRDLLLSVQDVDHATVDVAYMHHERIDELGYPRALKAHQIPYYAKLISVVDTYDAITSSRCYDSGRSSMEALDIIYKNRNRQFDEDLALEFIKFIGIYPPGSIVQMTNGEVGIVLTSNKSNKLRPRVLMVLDKDKKPVAQFVIDLSDTPKDLEGEPYMISGELPNGKYGVDVREFLKKGLVIKR